MNKKKLSASVVTYNSEYDIRGVMDSIYSSSCIEDLDVYVIDNGSSDRTIDILKKEYLRTRLIETGKNIGYGSGHNIALKESHADYHFVINPDVRFGNYVIEDIYNYMELDTETVLSIPTIYGENGERKYPPKRDPQLHYLLARYFPNMPICKKWINEYCEIEKTTRAEQPFQINVCSGSFMAFRMKSIKAVNYFDEDYFLYFEDFDLSRRIRTQGKIMCLPNIMITHEGKREAHHSAKAKKLFFSSMITYYRKWGILNEHNVIT